MIVEPYTLEVISHGATAVDGWSRIEERRGTLEEIMASVREEIECAPRAFIKVTTATGIVIRVNEHPES